MSKKKKDATTRFEMLDPGLLDPNPWRLTLLPYL